MCGISSILNIPILLVSEGEWDDTFQEPPAVCLGKTLDYTDLPATRQNTGKGEDIPFNSGREEKTGEETTGEAERGGRRVKRGREGGRGFHTAEQARPPKPWTPTPKPKCASGNRLGSASRPLPHPRRRSRALLHSRPLCSNDIGTWEYNCIRADYL